MERAETLTKKVAELERTRTEVADRLASLEQEHATVLADLESEAQQVGSGRSDIVAGVGEELIGLYEKIRAQSGGIAAAELRQRRCGGCRLELNNVDFDRIRRAAEDEVIRCEECRRIMIRTGESGL